MPNATEVGYDANDDDDDDGGGQEETIKRMEKTMRIRVRKGNNSVIS